MSTELDVLVIENFILIKDEQNKETMNQYFNDFDLD